MLKSLLLTSCLLAAAFVNGEQSFGPSRNNNHKHYAGRPKISAYPHSPSKPHCHSPVRTKTCTVSALGNGTNDAPNILAAAHACNHGGTITLLDAVYTIGSPLDLTFLSSVDIVIGGTIKFTDDIPFWIVNSFKYAYQGSSTFWQIGGKDVNIYDAGNGTGTIDGSGQAWYDAFAKNATLERPILFVVLGLDGGSVSGLRLTQSPNWFFLVANSTDVIFDDIHISIASSSSNPAKNTGTYSSLSLL
jgi:galacturan 1,4-alpha-galacturonidase